MSLCGYMDILYQLIHYGACLCSILYFLMWLYGNITLPCVKIFCFYFHNNPSNSMSLYGYVDFLRMFNLYTRLACLPPFFSSCIF